MKYIFLHGLGQVPSDWETTIKRLDFGLDVDCPDLSDWLSGKEASYFNLYRALESYCDSKKDLCIYVVFHWVESLLCIMHWNMQRK